jgi:short-subunit dehydrogenase
MAFRISIFSLQLYSLCVMRTQGGGSIVNINSGTAFMTVPQYSVYSSSKRALLGFSLTARAELEKDRIVVSEIYPFITATILA